MSHFWKQFREFLVPIGMVGLFAALIYFGIIRIMQENKEKMISIQKAMVDRKMLEEQANGISSMREESDRIRSADEKLSVFLPKDRIVSLVENLEMIGKGFDVSIVSEASSAPTIAKPAKKKPSKENADLSENKEGASPADAEGEKRETLVPLLPEGRLVSIVFKVTGKYENTLAFLQKLDTMPTLLDVLSLEIISAPIEENQMASSSFTSGLLANPFQPIESSPEKIPSEKPKMVTASFQTVIYTTL